MEQKSCEEILLKYFPEAYERKSNLYLERKVRTSDLDELLEEYNLTSWYEVFFKLAEIILNSYSIIDKNKKFLIQIAKEHEERKQIIKASKALQNANIHSVKIVLATSGNKQSFVLKEKDLIKEIGNLLYQEYYIKAIQQGYSAEELNKEPEKYKQPNIRHKIRQAFLSFRIQNFLDKETELKTGNTLITNKQAMFIYDFLNLSDCLGIDTSKVLQEEYIRTLFSNHSKKFKFWKI